MRARYLFLVLILYTAFVWVVAAYRHSGETVVEKGLLWTAIGIGAVLALVVFERLYVWWQGWRAKRSAQPKLAPKPASIVHEDDAAFASLWREAENALAGRRIRIGNLPMFLLLGPPGSGKTSTLLNSGAEFHPLAGQLRAEGAILPTPVANLWLAKEGLFVEVGGRIYDGDLERWRQFLQNFLSRKTGPWWETLWKKQQRRPALRSIILFHDIGTLRGSPESNRLAKQGRMDMERLQAVADVFGYSVPVYGVFSKSDAVPFFEDYFARLPEPEASQAVGFAMPFQTGGATPSADSVRRTLERAFGRICYHLADRRVLHLARENDPVRKPGVYEFPRELKRLRPSVVQLLMETFRPNPLKVSPVLRGIYITGSRDIEGEIAPNSEWKGDTKTPGFKPDATQIFRPGATQIFRPGTGETGTSKASGAVRRQWMFARQLFSEIVPRDRVPVQAVAPLKREPERYGQFAAGAAACLAGLAGLLWLQSWFGNRQLLQGVETAVHAATLDKTSTTPPELPPLQRLESLRQRLVELQSDPPWRMRWGLYAGNSVLPEVRRAYFEQADRIILGPAHRQLIADLRALPMTPRAGDSFEPAYPRLQAVMATSSANCKAEPQPLGRTLKAAARDAGVSVEGEIEALVDRQIDQYVAELASENPLPRGEEAAVRDHARNYLKHFGGLEHIYREIVTEAGQKLGKPLRLADSVPEYPSALAGPAEIAAVYTPAGWPVMDEAAKKAKLENLGDGCVLGQTSGDGSARAIRYLYLQDYKAKWKTYLAKFAMQPYRGLDDAARKLELLSGQKSPILGLFAFVGSNTNFDSKPVDPAWKSTVAKAGQKVGLGDLFKKGEKAEKMAKTLDRSEPEANPDQITKAFQPVHFVVPPNSARWIEEKNKAYVDALADLRQQLVGIARSSSTSADPAVHQAALASYDKAMETVRQIAIGFQPIGSEGVDGEVRTLLEQPIRQAKRFIHDNPDKVAAGKLNAELAALAGKARPVFAKYPFLRTSAVDATLEEVSSLFDPANGAIWKFAASLGEQTAKQGNEWVAKLEPQKPAPSRELMDFLNTSQKIADAFYSKGATQPALRYVLRPNMPLDAMSLEFECDGKKYSFGVFQQTFTWPAPAGQPGRCVYRVVTGGAKPSFASASGLWGVFKIFRDAEPRPVAEKNVEWKFQKLAGGGVEALDPPVRMQFVEFPGGVDLFNPRFFERLRLPAKVLE